MMQKPAAGSRPDDATPSPVPMSDGWNEEEHSRIDYAECTDARCKNVDANVGFQGMLDFGYPGDTWTPNYEAPKRGNQPVGDDLRAAWKAQLEREGKHGTGGTSLRDVILGDSPENG